MVEQVLESPELFALKGHLVAQLGLQGVLEALGGGVQRHVLHQLADADGVAFSHRAGAQAENGYEQNGKQLLHGDFLLIMIFIKKASLPSGEARLNERSGIQGAVLSDGRRRAVKAKVKAQGRVKSRCAGKNDRIRRDPGGARTAGGIQTNVLTLHACGLLSCNRAYYSTGNEKKVLQGGIS